MRKRKPSTRQKFFAKRGLKRVPWKVIDHKVPLKDGGTDTLWNLRLISKKSHQKKIAREARRKAGRK